MNKKKVYIIVLIAVALMLALLTGGKGAEAVAEDFVENMLAGNGKKCVALMTDDAVAKTGSATRKILARTMDIALADMQEEYKDKYGKKWTYEVVVVDSYDITGEYYGEEHIGDAVEVVVEIQHKGSGFFNDETGIETETLVLVNENGDWLVSGFSS